MKSYEMFGLGIPLTGLLAITGALCGSMVGETFMPLMSGVFMDGYGKTMQQAGNYISIEMAGLALATFLLAPFVGTTSRKAIALVGLVIAASGYILTGISTEHIAFLRFY